MNARTRQFMKKLKALNPKDDLSDCIWQKKKKEKEVCLHATIRVMEEYVNKCKDKLFTGVSNRINNKNNVRTSFRI